MKLKNWKKKLIEIISNTKQTNTFMIFKKINDKIFW